MPANEKVVSEMKMNLKLLSCFLCAVIAVIFALSTKSYAQDGPVIELSTTVTGNQEQPKVLYIVPWQAAEDNALLYQALSRHTSDAVFGHVERSEHQREIEFLGEVAQP